MSPGFRFASEARQDDGRPRTNRLRQLPIHRDRPRRDLDGHWLHCGSDILKRVDIALIRVIISRIHSNHEAHARLSSRKRS